MAESLDNSNELEGEIEILSEIYINELEVHRDSCDFVQCVELKLHPATGDQVDEKWVCLTLTLTPPWGYPEDPPEIQIKNPRGLAEDYVNNLEESLHELAEERRGECMLFELIEFTKDWLTQDNIPHGECVICKEEFLEEDSFTKTECYHYFHCHCLFRYIEYSEKEIEEEYACMLQKSRHMNIARKQVVCPVCRTDIVYDLDSFAVKSVPSDLVPHEVIISAEVRKLQDRMKKVYLHQKHRGGIIDLEAEKKKFLIPSVSTQLDSASASESVLVAETESLPEGLMLSSIEYLSLIYNTDLPYSNQTTAEIESSLTSSTTGLTEGIPEGTDSVSSCQSINQTEQKLDLSDKVGTAPKKKSGQPEDIVRSDVQGVQTSANSDSAKSISHHKYYSNGYGNTRKPRNFRQRQSNGRDRDKRLGNRDREANSSAAYGTSQPRGNRPKRYMHSNNARDDNREENYVSNRNRESNSRYRGGFGLPGEELVTQDLITSKSMPQNKTSMSRKSPNNCEAPSPRDHQRNTTRNKSVKNTSTRHHENSAASDKSLREQQISPAGDTSPRDDQTHSRDKVPGNDKSSATSNASPRDHHSSYSDNKRRNHKSSTTGNPSPRDHHSTSSDMPRNHESSTTGKPSPRDHHSTSSDMPRDRISSTTGNPSPRDHHSTSSDMPRDHISSTTGNLSPRDHQTHSSDSVPRYHKSSTTGNPSPRDHHSSYSDNKRRNHKSNATGNPSPRDHHSNSSDMPRNHESSTTGNPSPRDHHSSYSDMPRDHISITTSDRSPRDHQTHSSDIPTPIENTGTASDMCDDTQRQTYHHGSRDHRGRQQRDRVDGAEKTHENRSSGGRGSKSQRSHDFRSERDNFQTSQRVEEFHCNKDVSSHTLKPNTTSSRKDPRDMQGRDGKYDARDTYHYHRNDYYHERYSHPRRAKRSESGADQESCEKNLHISHPVEEGTHQRFTAGSEMNREKEPTRHKQSSRHSFYSREFHRSKDVPYESRRGFDTNPKKASQQEERGVNESKPIQKDTSS